MEGIGAAASIIAIVELSAKVASVILQYSKDVKNAGDDIHRLRKAVTDLKKMSHPACGNCSIAQRTRDFKLPSSY